MPKRQPPTVERLDALTTDIEAAVRRHDPDWTGASSGDPGVALLELMAWIVDGLSAYQDGIARDSGLSSARRFHTNASRFDPYKNFKFRVKWDDAYVSGITRVSGLARTVQAVEYREGGDPTAVHRVPGAIGYDAITIERTISHDTAFEDWANQVRQAAAGTGVAAAGGTASYLKSVRIEVLNEAGQPVIAYDLNRCWPSLYRPLPELVSGEPLRLVETITLAHDGWQRDPAVVYPS